jgi:hypothetical protein
MPTRKQVEISPSRDGDKEIARNDFAAVDHSGLRDGSLAALESVRQIKQDTSHTRITLQDFANHVSMTSTHINDLGGFGKVVRLQNTREMKRRKGGSSRH